MATTTNEGRCCDAVLRILEEQHGAKRKAVVRDTPEKRGIEVSCIIGDQHYAVEHTLIEPFPDNQRDNIAFTRVLDNSFVNEMRDLLRRDLAYNIYVDVYAFQGLSTKALKAAREWLLTWARAEVLKLPVPPVSGPPERRVFGEPPATPVRVMLACHRSTVLGGKLLFGRFAPPNLDALRNERLLRALQDKSPKLHAARRSGTRTVLIAENNDIALTAASEVGDVFNALAAQVSHMPDDIYIVDTGTGGFFHVTQVRRARQVCLFVGDAHSNWEYKAAELADL